MPIYHALGTVPRSGTSVLREGRRRLYYEELIGNKGFVGPSSLLYHVQHPTQVRSVAAGQELDGETDPEHAFRHRHFRTAQPRRRRRASTADRIPLLFNHDVALDVRPADSEDDYFYRNAQGDEIVYVSDGAGVLETQLGELPFRRGDYLVIPRGILHRYRFTASARAAAWSSRARGYVRTPKRYRNEHGQLMESAPYLRARHPAAGTPRGRTTSGATSGSSSRRTTT